MIYLDTNILVRLVDGRPIEQAEAAIRLIDLHRSELYLPAVVFTETVFVLASFYKLTRAAIGASFGPIIESLRLAPEERTRMLRALDIFVERNVGILDAWLAAETLALGHRVATFDQDLRKWGADVLDPMTVQPRSAV